MTHPQAVRQDSFDGSAARQLEPRFAADDFFDQQPTSTSALPEATTAAPVVKRSMRFRI